MCGGMGERGRRPVRSAQCGFPRTLADSIGSVTHGPPRDTPKEAPDEEDQILRSLGAAVIMHLEHDPDETAEGTLRGRDLDRRTVAGNRPERTNRPLPAKPQG